MVIAARAEPGARRRRVEGVSGVVAGGGRDRGAEERGDTVLPRPRGG